ncbi:PTS galactitol transporter subunit IIA [Rahnella bonaserana]|jgi:PTS system galactitol-specific IIA component|uniref:PTS galactitol transporter subunit IIA n=1 Tax=Rahnella bonaserana TaxID=2816248 RepID=A0ABS6LTE2_9GAMM|nr:PTS galactitol transporter subunit IIA [Rahnella bonaserana]MBU9855286.1 PTS galactitol transporter subunit IIA [Rahnella bonaserana]MCL9643075.1 PTS galactitol transporter subunit IIA [Rahnella victoriana]WHZ39857.1 PTS galactitol transporter subunit IIA [Rahnella bonaserana]
MRNCEVFVKTGISFADYHEALTHIGERMVQEDVVETTYPLALLNREAEFPTGIQLEHHAVAIPHCEATHARSPAIYLIRPDTAVEFFQADDDGTIPASLIIALIVTHPAEQLKLLRQLFSQLQDSAFCESLLTVPEEQLSTLFKKHIFISSPEKQSAACT